MNWQHTCFHVLITMLNGTCILYLVCTYVFRRHHIFSVLSLTSFLFIYTEYVAKKILTYKAQFSDRHRCTNIVASFTQRGADFGAFEYKQRMHGLRFADIQLCHCLIYRLAILRSILATRQVEVARSKTLLNAQIRQYAEEIDQELRVHECVFSFISDNGPK